MGTESDGPVDPVTQSDLTSMEPVNLPVYVGDGRCARADQPW